MIESIANRIIKEYAEYTDGVRVLMLLDRSIGNTNKGSKRWLNKLISTNPIEFHKCLIKLLSLQYYLNDHHIRLYSCLNSRKMDSAIKLFKHKQLDVVNDNEYSFYKNINDSFCSCLMAPENRAYKLYMLDIDSEDTLEADSFIYQHNIYIRNKFKSKKGWHYVVDPFNVLLAKNSKTFEVKNDALLLLNWL